MRPRIAITSWRRHLPTFVGERTLLFTLADEYVQSVADAGAIPLLLPHVDPGDIDDVLDAVDGLVIAGGGDVHPSSFGGRADASKDVDARADATELALARRAGDRGVPTLAICRGMQIVNVVRGGTLRQEICAPGTPHEPVSDDPAAVLAARHPVDIIPGSLLASVLGAGERMVNTIHHQAVDELGAGLRVTATSPDGVVESIEDEQGWPLLAVQWHPEKLDGQDAALFDWLSHMAVADRRRTKA